MIMEHLASVSAGALTGVMALTIKELAEYINKSWKARREVKQDESITLDALRAEIQPQRELMNRMVSLQEDMSKGINELVVIQRLFASSLPAHPRRRRK